MIALVAAFEPFGGDSVNASHEAVQRLPERIGSIRIRAITLPTSFARALPALDDAIERHAPALVLGVGQAEGRALLSLERVALNVQEARIPDNDGAQPLDVPVIAGAPSAYFATLPLRKALAALRAAELPAEISNSAGTFVCNQVFFGLMHRAATRGMPQRAGFLHLPPLGVLSSEDLARGVALVLEASL
jgi:pyroglutamyl-peptidase